MKQKGEDWTTGVTNRAKNSGEYSATLPLGF